MYFCLGAYYLLSIIFIHFIDARLTPLQQTANKLLNVDSISTDNIFNHPILSSNNRNSQRETPTQPRPNTTVCYPIVGCFDNNEPFNNAAFEVPQSPDYVNTAFLLFTQEAPTNPEFLSYDDDDDESIRKANINPSRWLRLIIHGFQNNRDSEWILPLRSALLKLKDVRK